MSPRKYDPIMEEYNSFPDPIELIYTTSKQKVNRLTGGKSCVPYKRKSFMLAHDLKEADKLRILAIEKKNWIKHIKSGGKEDNPDWLEKINYAKLAMMQELRQNNNIKLKDRVNEVNQENEKIDKRLRNS